MNVSKFIFTSGGLKLCKNDWIEKQKKTAISGKNEDK